MLFSVDDIVLLIMKNRVAIKMLDKWWRLKRIDFTCDSQSRGTRNGNAFFRFYVFVRVNERFCGVI